MTPWRKWGRDFSMNSSVAGVRQNLKLLVDHGKVSANANSDVMAKGKAASPTPVPLLPTQQPSPFSYYTPSTRDFTVVYAR